VDANELSVEIASRENAVDPSRVTGEQRSRVYVGLVQNHLDTLDELDAARYDSRSKLVKPTDATAPLARLIREVTTECYTPAEGGRVRMASELAAFDGLRVCHRSRQRCRIASWLG